VKPMAGTVDIDVDEIRNTGKFEARLKIPEGDFVLAIDKFNEFSACQNGGRGGQPGDAAARFLHPQPTAEPEEYARARGLRAFLRDGSNLEVATAFIRLGSWCSVPPSASARLRRSASRGGESCSVFGSVF
jgi:hypothetical protein